MDPFDFLETSQRLYAMPAPREADYRTIVSRTYYAFFLGLRDGLAAKDRGFNQALRHSGEDHGLVRRYLRGERFANGQSRGQMAPWVSWYATYEAVYRWREQADYVIAAATIEWADVAAMALRYSATLRPLIESYVRR